MNQKLEKAVRGVETVWTLIKIVLVLGIVVVLGLAQFTSSDDKKPESFKDFLALASPLEGQQNFTLNKHVLPVQASVLPAVPEAERLQNPGATAVQIARAKWIERTWNEVEKTGEPGRKINGGKPAGVAAVLGGFISAAMGKEEGQGKKDASSAEIAAKQLLVGDAVVPSLVSGTLPVFSDADTAKVQAEQVKQGVALGELDYRRALWFVVKYGAGNKPAPAPSDVEIRAAEAANKPKPNGWGQVERQNVAPWSDNERMARAVDVLNSMYAPNPAAAPAAAVAGGK